MNYRTELINDILEALHYGQVVQFTYCGHIYAFESLRRTGDDFHTLGLYHQVPNEPISRLVFKDKISFTGTSTDYPIKFEDNYPIAEIRKILEREKVFDGKNLFAVLDEISDVDIQ